MKQRRRNFFKGVLIVGMLLFFLFSVPEVSAEEQVTVKVGYSNSEFLHAGSRNVYEGYGFELLQMIAQYEPLKYEYIYANPTELRRMLDSGEIDLIAPMNKTKKLEEKYDFTDLSIGSSQMVIASDGVNDLSEQIASGKIVVGMVRNGTAGKKAFEEYCKENQIKAITVQYSSFANLKDNLKLKKIDAVFSDRWDVNNYQIFARFHMRNMYMAVKKGNTALLQYLNDGLEKVELDSPEYHERFYDKYYAQYDITGMVLNREEKDYIKKLGTIKVAVPEDTVPLQYEDAEGKIQGIHIRVLEEVARKTGLSFEYVKTASLNDTLDMVKNKEIDIISGVVDNVNWADSNDLMLTSSYMDNVMTVVRRGDQKASDGKTVLATYNNNFSLMDYYRSSILQCSSLEECFQAVKEGEASFTYGNIYAVEYLRLKADFQQFAVSVISGSGGKFCFAMANSGDMTLYRILNKAVKGISTDTIEDFVNTISLEQEVEFSLAGYVYNHTLEVIVVIFLVALIIVALTIWRMRKNTILEKQLSEQYMMTERRYQKVMEFSGENLFEYDAGQDTMYFSKSMAERFGIERVYKHFKKFHIIENVVHPEDLRLCEEFLVSLLRQKFQDKQIQIRILNKMQEYEPCYLYGCTVSSNQEGRADVIMGRLFNEDARQKENNEKKDYRGIYSYLEVRDSIVHRMEAAEKREKHVMILMDIHFHDGAASQEDQELFLQRAAESIHSCIRETDIIGRSGDNQLILFMARIQSREQIENKLDRLKRLLREEFYADDAEISVGYSVYPLQGGNYEELYEKAVSGMAKL